MKNEIKRRASEVEFEKLKNQITSLLESIQRDLVLGDVISDCTPDPEQREIDKREFKKYKNKVTTLSHNSQKLMHKHKLWLVNVFRRNKKMQKLYELVEELGDLNFSVRSKTAEINRGDIPILIPTHRTLNEGIGPSFIHSVDKGNLGDVPTIIRGTMEHENRTVNVCKAYLFIKEDKTGKFLFSEVAVKRSTPDKSGADQLQHPERVHKRSKRERCVWSRLALQNHPNILPFYGDYIDKSQQSDPEPQRNIYLVSPWASGGTVISYLRNLEDPSEHAKKLIGDIVLGLSYLHSGFDECGLPKDRVLHGDIYPSNILVHIPECNPHSRAKPIAWIADFGLSTDNMEASTYLTQESYRAPEFENVLVKADASTAERMEKAAKMEKADVYSFGLVVFSMLTGIDLRGEHGCGTHKGRESYLEYFGDRIPEGLLKLVKACCQSDPADRPTMAEVKDICRHDELVPLMEEYNREMVAGLST